MKFRGDEITQSTSLIFFCMEAREENLVRNYLCQIGLRLEGSDVHPITTIQHMTASYFLTATTLELPQAQQLHGKLEEGRLVQSHSMREREEYLL
jgi:hypothetical protein